MWPSPIRHTTSAGAAVAVADTGPAAAVADNGRHAAGSTHNQLLTFTSWSRFVGGAIPIVGVGNGNSDTACWTRTAGFTAGAAGWFGPVVTQITGIGSIVPGPAHTGSTHSPGVGPPGPRASNALGPVTT
ncbi:MAG: hypothetical protein ACYCUG_00875 [Acidimicrobiales bacterium]